MDPPQHRRRRPAADIRDLIANDVDAIVFNPNDPDALNPALDEAQAAGIKTISVDASVTDPDTYNLYNNQVEYAKSAPSGCSSRWAGTNTATPAIGRPSRPHPPPLLKKLHPLTARSACSYQQRYSHRLERIRTHHDLAAHRR